MGNGAGRQEGANPTLSGASVEAFTRLAETGRYFSPARRSPSPGQRLRQAPTHPDALVGGSSDEAHRNDAELCYRFPEKHVPRSRPNSPPPPPPLPLPLPLQMPATPRAARRHIKGEESTRDWRELGPRPQQTRHDDAASSSSQSSFEGSPLPWARGDMEIAPRIYEQRGTKDKDSTGPAGAAPLWSPQSSRPASPQWSYSSRPASPMPRPLQVQYLTSTTQPEAPPPSSRPASPLARARSIRGADVDDTESPRSPPPELRLTKHQAPQWRSKPLQTPPMHLTPNIGLSPPQMLMTPSLPQLPPLQPPLMVPPCGAGMEPMFGASRSATSCTTASPSSPQGLPTASPLPGWQSARSSATSLHHALVTEHDSRDSGMMSERWQTPRRRLPPPSELLQGSWVAGAWKNTPVAPSHHSAMHGSEHCDARAHRANFQVRTLPPDPDTALSWVPPGAGEMAPFTPSTPSALASIVPSPHGRVRLHVPQHASKNTLELAALSHRVNSVLQKCKSQLERPQGGTPVSERGDGDQNISQVVVQDVEAGGDISFGAALNSSLRSTCTFGVRDPSLEGSGLPGHSPQNKVKRTLPDQVDGCCTSTSASSSSSGSPLPNRREGQSHAQSRQSLSSFSSQLPDQRKSIPNAFRSVSQDGRRASEPIAGGVLQKPWKQQHVQTHDSPSPATLSTEHGLGAKARQRSSPGGNPSHHVAHAERTRAASVTSRAVSPFHARIASNCDALETEMMRAREERSRRASKVNRIIADSKLAPQQSGQTRITQLRREEVPRRTITTHQLPAPPMEAPWAEFQGHLS